MKFIENEFPTLKEYISHNLSPMAMLGKVLKEKDPSIKTVFIGPCTAKKDEIRKDNVKEYIDSCLTFLELDALFEAKDIDLASLQEDKVDDASYFGRVFARSGGLVEAVKESLKEQNNSFEVKPIMCSGLNECFIALMKKKNNILNANFIEGMACNGGCINGAGVLNHDLKNKLEVDKYGKESNKTILEAINND